MRTKKNNIVSYNVAKKLKDFGFNEDVYFRIYPDGSIATSGYLCDYNSKNEFNACSAPTLSETVDWIYDTFGIFIEIDYIRIPYNFGKKFKYFVIDITDENGFGGDIIVRSDDAFETKDDAIIEAINHLFNKLEKICSLHKVETKPIEVPKENFTFDGVELKVKSEKIEVV